MFSYKLINYHNSKSYNLVNKIKRNSKQVIRKISFLKINIPATFHSNKFPTYFDQKTF